MPPAEFGEGRRGYHRLRRGGKRTRWCSGSAARRSRARIPLLSFAVRRLVTSLDFALACSGCAQDTSRLTVDQERRLVAQGITHARTI